MLCNVTNQKDLDVCFKAKNRKEKSFSARDQKKITVKWSPEPSIKQMNMFSNKCEDNQFNIQFS